MEASYISYTLQYGNLGTSKLEDNIRWHFVPNSEARKFCHGRSVVLWTKLVEGQSRWQHLRRSRRRGWTVDGIHSPLVTRRIVYFTSVDRSVINNPITAICCTTRSYSCAAVDKISTDIARRAVRLRQQSFLLAQRLQSADLVQYFMNQLPVYSKISISSGSTSGTFADFSASSPRYVHRRKRRQFSSVASSLSHWTITCVINWARCRRCVCLRLSVTAHLLLASRNNPKCRQNSCHWKKVLIRIRNN